MDIATGNWFDYLNEEILTEGLRDIGLPESVIDFIESGMPHAPEKSKMYVGNEWKKSTMSVAARDEYIDGVWHKFMLRNFRNQIQSTGEVLDADIPPRRSPNDPRTDRPQARTHAVYDEAGMEGSPAEKRVKYDEGPYEQNKMVAFVIENIDNVLSKPMGTWRKAFAKALKALSKAGIRSEKVEIVKNELDRVTIYEFRRFWNRWNILFAWLNDEPTNYEMIKGDDSIQDASDTAQKDLENKEDPDNVLHTFEDGYYWIDLKKDYCAVEAERMGHCGRDERGTIVSLRKHEEARKASDSYITLSWNEEEAILYQIKGRANDVPTEDIWHTVAWFINHMDVTNVQESGEHSNNPRGFVAMNEYLEEETDAIFSGEDVVDVDQRIETINEAVRIIDENFADRQIGGSDPYTDVGCYAEDGEEMGAEPGTVYLSMNCDWNVSIDLGWPGFELRNNEYTPTLGPDDTTQDEGYETIPRDTYGGEARDFRSELGLDDMSYELPGENPEEDYEVDMIEGTAHLLITIKNSETETANDDDDASEYDVFADTALNFDRETAENKEKLRTALAAGGYSVKTVYDRERAEMSEYDLGHWKVWSGSGPGIEFWFKPEATADSLVPAGEVPVDLMMWGPAVEEQNLNNLYRLIFGVRNNGKDKYTSDDLNRNMARNLEAAYRDASSTAASTDSQGQLPFGDKYAAKFVPIVLARDSRFIIEGGSSYHGRGVGAYPKMPIGWRYTIGVDSSASDVEIETVKSIVKYFNEHPEMVITAAQGVISTALEGSMAIAQSKKEAVMSGKLPQAALLAIDRNFGVQLSNDGAKEIILTARWIKDNFDKMGAPEKWVAWYKYLDPMKRNSYSPHRNPIEAEGDSAGKPQRWDAQVQEQLRAMRASGRAVRDYKGIPQADPVRGTLGEPRAVEESIEEQIARVERLLNEDPSDVRLYKMQVDAVISADRADSGTKLLQDELRSIAGVTVVSVEVSRDLAAGTHLTRFNIKFSLKGQHARLEFVNASLIPTLRKVNGFEIKDWSTPVEITPGKNLRELQVLREYGFGGVAGNLGAQRFDRGNQMTTPRPALQTMVDDWAEGGVMSYDVPTDTTDMRYHVMLPVEELLPYLSSVYRGDMRDFTGRYQEFIKNGATAPVYVAIGMNGRVKVTGGEDIVWFAKKSGLAEVPVFFSYQKQV